MIKEAPFFLFVEAGLAQTGPASKRTSAVKQKREKNLLHGAVFFIKSARFTNNIFYTQRMRSVFTDLATRDINQPAPPLLSLRQKAISMRALRAMEKMPAPGQRPLIVFVIFFHHRINAENLCRSNNL